MTSKVLMDPAQYEFLLLERRKSRKNGKKKPYSEPSDKIPMNKGAE